MREEYEHTNAAVESKRTRQAEVYTTTRKSRLSEERALSLVERMWGRWLNARSHWLANVSV